MSIEEKIQVDCDRRIIDVVCEHLEGTGLRGGSQSVRDLYRDYRWSDRKLRNESNAKEAMRKELEAIHHVLRGRKPLIETNLVEEVQGLFREKARLEEENNAIHKKR